MGSILSQEASDRLRAMAPPYSKKQVMPDSRLIKRRTRQISIADSDIDTCIKLFSALLTDSLDERPSQPQSQEHNTTKKFKRCGWHCVVCYSSFSIRWRDKKCCSPECRDKYLVAKPWKRKVGICTWCKSEFWVGNVEPGSPYCQKACLEKATRSAVGQEGPNKVNPAEYKNLDCDNQRKRRNRAFAYRYKVANGCSRCSERRPSCLDFHHTDSGTKKNTVARLVGMNISINRIAAEISKCVILCANCHRVETWGDGYKDYSDVPEPLTIPADPIWRKDKLFFLKEVFDEETVSEQTTCLAP